MCCTHACMHGGFRVCSACICVQSCFEQPGPACFASAPSFSSEISERGKEARPGKLLASFAFTKRPGKLLAGFVSTKRPDMLLMGFAFTNRPGMLLAGFAFTKRQVPGSF